MGIPREKIHNQRDALRGKKREKVGGKRKFKCRKRREQTQPVEKKEILTTSGSDLILRQTIRH